jgi:hypothetical protein
MVNKPFRQDRGTRFQPDRKTPGALLPYSPPPLTRVQQMKRARKAFHDPGAERLAFSVSCTGTDFPSSRYS